MADQPQSLDPAGPGMVATQRLFDFAAMLDIAKANPVYFKGIDFDNWAIKVLGEAARNGKYVLLADPMGRPAFFTYLRPRWPLRSDEYPGGDQWKEEGPVLWIGDVCCHPKTSGQWMGKVIRLHVKKRGLAKPGERCVYWRSTRFGWFVVE